MKHLVSLLVATVVACGLLWYSLRGVDMGTLKTTLASGDYSSFGFFALALVAYYWLKALRWASVLSPLGQFSWRDVAPAMMIGFAGNNVLPSHLGELIQTVVFSKRNALPASSVLVTQMVERLLDVGAVLLLFFVALLFLTDVPDGLRLSAEIALATTLLGVTAVALAIARPHWLFKLWGQCATILPPGVWQWGHGLLENIILALNGLRSPRRLAVLIANSIAQWAAMAFIIWIALLTFGVTIGPWLALITLAATVVAITLPSLPGNFGSVQAAYVFALVPFGVAQESALAASVYYLLAQWIPVTIVGGVCFVFYGLGMSEVKHQIDTAQRNV